MNKTSEASKERQLRGTIDIDAGDKKGFRVDGLMLGTLGWRLDGFGSNFFLGLVVR